jgi:hypothetical protein
MKQMHLQELMNLVVVVEFVTTLLKMLDPVETCILNLRREVLFYSTALHVSDEYTGSAHDTDVLFESCGHKPYTAIG